jgi:hypothetical protein
MRTLRNTLHDLEPGELRIIAERWGLDEEAASGAPSSDRLAAWMLQPENLTEQLTALTDGEVQVLDALRRNGGRLALDQAERRFGAWRRMGAARRERLRPHDGPTGPLESLVYTGLIGRAFADTPGGAQEFVFLPSDLLPRLPEHPAEPVWLTPAAEPAQVVAARSASAEDCVTLLAALRRRPLRSLDHLDTWIEPVRAQLFCPEAAGLLVALLSESGALSPAPHHPQAEQAGHLLQSLHAERQRLLVKWSESSRWSDLSQVPTLACETPTWPGNPLAARKAVLGILDRLPRGVWYDMAALVQWIRRTSPDFQRTSGEFEAWYLRHRATGEFLRGFEHWEEVEGALIRYLVCGPLHWLGAADLGHPAVGSPPDRFRLVHPPEPPPPASAEVNAEGVIRAPAGMVPAQRYQLARICEWEAREEAGFVYRLTPSVLRLAFGQGLRREQVIALLEAAIGRPLPPHLEQALLRTDPDKPPYAEAGLVLHFPDEHMLEALRSSKEAARLLGERVGKNAVLVRPGSWERLRALAARMGILLDGPPTTPGSRRRG